MISGLNWFILNKFCRNSSFTGSVGLIIASSRSGTSFSSRLASSIYFSITKKCIFLGKNFLFVSGPPDAHPLQPISGPCSIEKYPFSRMANGYPASLMRADHSSVWICGFGAWNCQLGVWMHHLGVWICQLGSLHLPLPTCAATNHDFFRLFQSPPRRQNLSGVENDAMSVMCCQCKPAFVLPNFVLDARR